MKKSVTIVVVLILFSCNNFVEIETPKTQIINQKVFENDAGARSAVIGVYSQIMTATSFASGGYNGVTAIAALSADELDNHALTPDRIAISDNSLTALNTVSSLWTEIYLSIYEANAIIEGVKNSTTLTSTVKDQVTGEALFIRAFGYFYLVNFFGDVPLLTSTDYRTNRVATRSATADVYQQIENDLRDAQKLLLTDYSFSNEERIEPNKWVATALLSRAYLYQKKWSQAEAMAASIIEEDQFSLAADLNSVFLANSSEAIWQLMPVLPRLNTFDGPYFFGEYSIVDVSINSSVMDAFEPGDNRASSWIATSTTDDYTYSYAYKYKVVFGDQPLTEYQMVFRLAEQYLIRSEARAMQNDLSGAIDDINTIRVRAGLDPLDDTGITQDDALDAIAKERRAELFLEWGHRWFDLKRTGKIDAVLSPVKPDWQSKDALFPIPQAEINANPNLKQNP
jgi:hypothetical protein